MATLAAETATLFALAESFASSAAVAELADNNWFVTAEAALDDAEDSELAA